MTSTFPNYYELLHIPPTATGEEIRTAYKKESLRTHPDRLGNATPEEKRVATEKFQAVADAYYVLSDPIRRKEYDTLYAQRTKYSSADPGASESFFTQFANMFSGPGNEPPPRRPDADGVFGEVFEDLLRPEVEKRANWWTYLGAASGASLGYIIANIPGMIMGGYAGNRLGAIRDAKGKPVAVVFAQLGGSQKAEASK
ncbi:J domain-containing protein C63,13 [Ceratobasidium theobromae]|uniref:J domain-containing protein C63,13 n=1 Tax=Ceratobasidium theobromae TaxID=1582974 RepID=A0A5N5QPW7_9AGAM|nr:J domain-containing protein C63,13 [Ceratobasidium theobromae]